MEKYDKQRLNEYVKELFSLCLDKDVSIYITSTYITIYIYANEMYTSYITEDLFSFNYVNNIPIWELIEKVNNI